MDIQVTKQTIKNVSCDALVVGATRTTIKTVELADAAQAVDGVLGGLLNELCTQGEFKGSLGEMTTVHPMGKLAAKRVILVGLGSQDTLNTRSLRRATAIAVRHLQNTGAHKIALALEGIVDAELQAQAQVEGALLGLYTFRKYQDTDEASNNKHVTKILLLTDNTHEQAFEQGISVGAALANATNFARDLINEPPNVLTPTELANRTSAMAKEFGLECEILEKAQMQELGMGGLLAVAQGSIEPPKFIILRYRGVPGSGDKGIALVGKGITFDTGGISIKPAQGMDEMKGDMGGAAAVIGAMQAIASLKPAVNVTALVSSTENMPGGSAYRPGDILRIMNGKTIEINNTDAEGRLVLADALSYAVKEGLTPIIDVATLTGGIVVALGHTMTGLFCNDEQLCNEIIEAGKIVGEKFWSMPLDEEYNELIKSDIADILQSGGRYASSVSAAKVLEHFVGDAKWAHLDIAGTSYVSSKKAYQEKGATGVGVRTLAEFALRQAK
ncbi:MAG: leucyl aminopeptidase [Chloroflexota bacterium]|nr:leucyl aminopeptidase [Chloroflexota bacterium]